MTNTATDRAEVTHVRVFDAPRALVFACMTDPDHLARFWGPVGMTTPRDRIIVDARVGGAFETVMVNDADGSEYAMQAVYTEVTPPEVLAWEEPTSGLRSRSTFVDLGDGRTEVRIHQVNLPAAFTAEAAQAGFKSSLDRFAEHLAHLQAA